MKSQLLCTFTYLDRLPICIGQIYKAYTADGAVNMKCYTYVETPNNVVCIYNVTTRERRLKDTISINRKKETNTLYSINALNNLIRVLNNGVLDKTHIVEWSHYTDTLLLASGEYDYKQIKIKELAY
jgi:hypothetical protein